MNKLLIEPLPFHSIPTTAQLMEIGENFHWFRTLNKTKKKTFCVTRLMFINKWTKIKLKKKNKPALQAHVYTKDFVKIYDHLSNTVIKGGKIKLFILFPLCHTHTYYYQRYSTAWSWTKLYFHWFNYVFIYNQTKWPEYSPKSLIGNSSTTHRLRKYTFRQFLIIKTRP